MAQYDLIIRGGTIVDGTGSPAFTGDVAVKDGLIAMVGRVTGSAAEEIDASGKVVWDLESYKQVIGLDKPAPETVNPSLWRNAQLNLQYGLFKVTDRIYQVRGFDLANISFIKGDTGWIVFDPLTAKETARAALELINEKLGKGYTRTN